MEGGFPISLEGATFEEWGQYVVPSGAHKDKTFEAMVQDASISRYYRNRTGMTSPWCQSLKAYINLVDGIDGFDVVDSPDKTKSKKTDTEKTVKTEFKTDDDVKVTVHAPAGVSVTVKVESHPKTK